MRIALLEDEALQMELLVATIEAHLMVGADVVNCARFVDGERLRTELRTDSYDLLILDWNVAGFDGLDLLRWLRNFKRSTVPVVMLSARGSEADVVAAFRAGANDYIVKPFRPAELTARIKRFAQPRASSNGWVESIDGWTFFHESAVVEFGEGASAQHFALSEREFSLAITLFRNLGRVVSRTHLLEAANQDSRTTSGRILDNQIFKLRVKLALAANGVVLQSVYGQGYRLASDGAAAPAAPAAQQ
jgi:DNA-binding response OmpR family regulator